jgi:hypothetical protein
LPLLLLSALLSGCNGEDQSAKDLAKKEAAILSGDNKGAAADNPRCKYFTAAEVAEYMGAPVASVQNAAMGLGCQWLAGNGGGDVIVTVAPKEYHEIPSLADGYKELTDVGEKGFVVPELGGWAAGAIDGDDAVRVSVAGPKANEAVAIALLKESIKRHHP